MNKGFSFIELMVVTLILSVVLGAIFAVAYQAQMSFESEKQFTETTQNARIAMDQIVRYIRQAGNDPHKKCITTAQPAVQIKSSTEIELNTDITGSIDGETGDPEGLLNSPFETVNISYSGGRVYIDFNDTDPPQVMADNISDFSFEFLDKNGVATASSDDVAMVRVHMTANTARPDRRTGQVNTITFHSDVFIRSKSFDLFAH